MAGIQGSPELTFEDAFSYITSVKDAFKDEPRIFQEFSKLLTDFTARRLDCASLITDMEQLLKHHQNQKLLPGFRVFHRKAHSTIPPKANRTIAPSEAEHHVPDSNCTKRSPVVSDIRNFLDKLKTRFGTNDHDRVLQSFCKIMKDFHEGKMSEEEVSDKVLNILYFHEDLSEHFSRFLTQKYSNLY